jgi:phospholipid/cholesterol/gamma-HCH transport system substrate-binding protein
MARFSGERTRGVSPFKAGILAIVVIGLLAYFGFTKANPFSHPFELKAVVEDAQNLQSRSPVRIAGVEVGKVTKVEPVQESEAAAKVTMELREDALPLREDAELKVRPRLFLEGNYFIDLKPGTPSAPELEDGDTVPRNQTSSSVSFSQVLSLLQSDVRTDLRTLLYELGTRGLKGGGAKGFNRAIPYFRPAYRLSALANDALLGLDPRRDQRRVLRGQQRTLAALGSDPEALKDLVTDLDTTAGALAREDVALEQSVPALRDTLRVAMPALASVNAALPTLRTFSREALPGVRSSGPTLDLAIPWIRQQRALMSEDELKGLARSLRRAIPSLVLLNRRQPAFLRQSRALASCSNHVLTPFSRSRIPSAESGNSGHEVRRQILRGFVGLAGESRNNDANTPYFHLQTVAPTKLGPPTGRLEPLSPPNPNTPLPHRPDVPCETQEPPNLDAPDGAGLAPPLGPPREPEENPWGARAEITCGTSLECSRSWCSRSALAGTSCRSSACASRSSRTSRSASSWSSRTPRPCSRDRGRQCGWPASRSARSAASRSTTGWRSSSSRSRRSSRTWSARTPPRCCAPAPA